MASDWSNAVDRLRHYQHGRSVEPLHEMDVERARRALSTMPVIVKSALSQPEHIYDLLEIIAEAGDLLRDKIRENNALALELRDLKADIATMRRVLGTGE